MRIDRFVQLAQEVYRLQVFPTAVAVRHPLVFLTQVVEVDHGCDGVHAQAVDMVFFEPEQGIGQQEVAYLAATIVKDKRTPAFMFAYTRVGVFIEVRTIEVAEGMAIFGEMRRNPVQDDTDILLVHVVHEILEILGSAVAARRRVVAGDLVAPGGIQGVLGDGQQLNMRKA